MPALPTTGEIRFSAIGTEFSDPYSLTDSTKTVRLSHYYKNIQDITTNHINTFPDSFESFRLISFRGKERFIEQESDDEDSGPPNPPNQTPNKGTSGNIQGSTGYEIITGLYANNTSRTEGTTSFDNRGATGNGTNNNVAYMNLIIQAKPGDVLNLIGRIRTNGNWKEYCEFWVWLGSWSKITHQYATFSGDKDFNINYTIPSNTVAGNYALAVACSYWVLNSTWNRSWKSYSLEIWTD
ncbi:hypothetical protein OAH43_00215 [bacterium]|nr:hypothetical protein [bacterium]